MTAQQASRLDDDLEQRLAGLERRTQPWARRAHYQRVERLERLKPPTPDATVVGEEFWAAVDDLLEALLADTDDE